LRTVLRGFLKIIIVDYGGMGLRLIGVLVFTMLAGCSLLGTNQWAAYKITVDVQNEVGQAISQVKLESNEVKPQITDENGRAVIQFRSAGLHVVTISADEKMTKQIKVSLPQDENKIFNVILFDRP